MVSRQAKSRYPFETALSPIIPLNLSKLTEINPVIPAAASLFGCNEIAVVVISTPEESVQLRGSGWEAWVPADAAEVRGEIGGTFPGGSCDTTEAVVVVVVVVVLATVSGSGGESVSVSKVVGMIDPERLVITSEGTMDPGRDSVVPAESVVNIPIVDVRPMDTFVIISRLSTNVARGKRWKA